jgi:prepilin-type N-terminal cleavage/methylation domain-containing protein
MKTCRNPALKRERQNGKGFTLIEIMIVIAIISLIMSIAIPYFIKYRSDSQAKACITNLKELDGAKQLWALDYKKSSTDTPVWGELIGSAGYIKNAIQCPTGVGYDIRSVEEKPLCQSGLVDSHGVLTHALP